MFCCTVRLPGGVGRQEGDRGAHLQFSIPSTQNQIWFQFQSNLRNAAKSVINSPSSSTTQSTSFPPSANFLEEGREENRLFV